MARLRNRIVKAEFWSDGELLRWPLAKRVMYQGLWAIAEDSGCLEDDPFEWRTQLLISPLDLGITLEMFTEWRNELVAAGKLIPYQAEGKQYVYIRTFHEHESPRNPQSPSLPLPPWVTCSVEGEGRSRRLKYVHSECPQTSSGHRSASVQSASGDRSTSPALSCPVQSSPLPPEREDGGDSDNQGKSPRSGSRKPRAVTCDGKPRDDCRALTGRCELRHDIAEIVGAEGAGDMYNAKSRLGRSLGRLCDRVCKLSQAEHPDVDREQRESLCTDALRRTFAGLADYHRRQGIRDLPSILASRAGEATLSDLAGSAPTVSAKAAQCPCGLDLGYDEHGAPRCPDCGPVDVGPGGMVRRPESTGGNGDLRRISGLRASVASVTCHPEPAAKAAP